MKWERNCRICKDVFEVSTEQKDWDAKWYSIPCCSEKCYRTFIGAKHGQSINDALEESANEEHSGAICQGTHRCY